MKKLTTYFSKGELTLWGSSSVLILVSFFLFDRVNFMTLVASLIGITSLIFNAKGNPIGHLTSERSKRQIKLIRAIDRKIALDDFAENENVDLNDVLDELETMLQHGKRMDITYFTDEVLGKEDVEDVRMSMGPNPDMNALRQEWGDVYNEEELRLLHYILS